MRKLLAAIILAALSASPLFTAPAQAQTPIKIMVGGIDKQIYLPAKLAAQLGFFKEQGLDVELFNSNSGSQAATALLAREVQGVVGFYDHTIDLQSKGKFITSVVQFGIAPGEVVLVKAADADKLKDPANWKGQALGVTGLGSATDFLGAGRDSGWLPVTPYSPQSHSQACSASGQWTGAGTACPFVCSGGSCTGVCAPSTKQCSGLTPQTCSATGASPSHRRARGSRGEAPIPQPPPSFPTWRRPRKPPTLGPRSAKPAWRSRRPPPCRSLSRAARSPSCS